MAAVSYWRDDDYIKRSDSKLQEEVRDSAEDLIIWLIKLLFPITSTFKHWPKIRHMRANSFGISVSNPTKLTRINAKRMLGYPAPHERMVSAMLLQHTWYRIACYVLQQTTSLFIHIVTHLTCHCLCVCKAKGAYSALWIGNPSQSYRASPAIWDHTVLPATWHRWTHPTLTPAMQAGNRFTYPGGMEGWVDLGGWLYTEMVYLSYGITQCYLPTYHSVTYHPTQ